MVQIYRFLDRDMWGQPGNTTESAHTINRRASRSSHTNAELAYASDPTVYLTWIWTRGDELVGSDRTDPAAHRGVPKFNSVCCGLIRQTTYLIVSWLDLAWFKIGPCRFSRVRATFSAHIADPIRYNYIFIFKLKVYIFTKCILHIKQMPFVTHMKISCIR